MNNKTKQKYLKQLGFYTGNIDGKIGPLSIKAIKDFQKSQNLKIDGICGPITSRQLEFICSRNWQVGNIKFTYYTINNGSITVYADKNILVSKNFRLYEYMMNSTTCNKLGINNNFLELYEQIVVAGQKLRDKFGSCTVNSAYRCEKYNKAIGGASSSMHIIGGALDLKFNSRPSVVQAYVRKNYKSLGIYGLESKTKPNCNQYTHIDIKKRNGNNLVEF